MTIRDIFTGIEPPHHWHALSVFILKDWLELLPMRGGVWGEFPEPDPLPPTPLRYAHICADYMRN